MELWQAFMLGASVGGSVGLFLGALLNAGHS